MVEKGGVMRSNERDERETIPRPEANAAVAVGYIAVGYLVTEGILGALAPTGGSEHFVTLGSTPDTSAYTNTLEATLYTLHAGDAQAQSAPARQAA